MANSLYGKGREKFLRGQLDWATSNIKAILVDNAYYTVDINAHEFVSSVPALARIAVSTNLTGKTDLLGIADADNVTFPLVSGATAEALILYKDTGVEGTSPLIAYWDTASGLVLTPNGGDVIVNWDNGPNKIFKL